MENNNVNVEVKETEKKLSWKEKRLAKRKAEFERRQNMTFEELEFEKKQKIKKTILLVTGFGAATGAAYAAGKAAAGNYYAEALEAVNSKPEPEIKTADVPQIMQSAPEQEWTGNINYTTAPSVDVDL